MPVMTLTSQIGELRSYVRRYWPILLKEVTAFGAVGIVSLFIDLGIYNALFQYGNHKAKCVSTVVATTFAYFGNRYLSFSHRARTSIGRETSFFFAINLIILGVSELVLAVFAYPLGYGSDRLVMNIVNFATIGIGTIIRFWAYKRFVFLHPDRVNAPDVDLDLELAE